MKTGRFGSSENDLTRYAIGFSDGTEYTLHCGDMFMIEIAGIWHNVRIEYGENGWYFIDENEKIHDVPWLATKARI